MAEQVLRGHFKVFALSKCSERSGGAAVRCAEGSHTAGAHTRYGALKAQ